MGVARFVEGENKMAGRRVGQKVIDWAKMGDVVPSEAKERFLAFKGRYEATLARVNSYPDKLQPIDWSYYTDRVSKPGLVEEFQKKYSSFSMPYPEDKTSAELAENEKEIEKLSLETIKNAKEEAVALKEVLKTINAQKSFEDMTVDEYLDNKPALRAQMEKDIENYKWYVPPK